MKETIEKVVANQYQPNQFAVLAGGVVSLHLFSKSETVLQKVEVKSGCQDILFSKFKGYGKSVLNILNKAGEI